MAYSLQMLIEVAVTQVENLRRYSIMRKLKWQNKMAKKIRTEKKVR